MGKRKHKHHSPSSDSENSKLSGLTSDKTILSWVGRFKIPFQVKVVQKNPPSEPQWPPQGKVQILEQIIQLEEKGAIKRVNWVNGQFLSRIFLVSKPDGSNRLILNLKKLIQFIKTENFKLEDGKTVHKLLSSNWHMATVDLKDAYYLIPIAKSGRKYLRFIFEGIIYEFECVPFSLSVAPYTFTKIYETSRFTIKRLRVSVSGLFGRFFKFREFI